MKRVGIMIATGMALAACGAMEPGEATGEALQPDSSADPVDLSDGLITCAMPDYGGLDGIEVTQSFILIDGQVKRYSDFHNEAFDLCQTGRKGCALAIEDGTIRMDYTAPKGTRSRYEVDLASLLITARDSKAGSEDRVVSFEEGAKCRRAPLPDGLRIM